MSWKYSLDNVIVYRGVGHLRPPVGMHWLKGQRRKNDSVALRGALSRFTQNPWQDCRTGDRPRRVGGSALEQGTLRSPI